MKVLKSLPIITVALFIFTGCEKKEPENADEIKIGNQIWSTKNLNVDKFRNGDPIPFAETSTEWLQGYTNKLGVWCYYDNDPENGEKCGKLYNWHAVTDPRGLAPEGWHIPTSDEWEELIEYLGGSDVAGKKLKNKNGFAALLGGYRSSSLYFDGMDKQGHWYSSSENNSNVEFDDVISFWMVSDADFFGKIQSLKEDGKSIRLIKD